MISDVAPIALVFGAAFGLKRLGLLSPQDGGALLRAVFALGAPALIFLSITRVDIDASFLRLCLVSPLIVGISLAVVLLLRRRVLRNVDVARFAPFVTGVVVMNTGFLIPFVERATGAEGLARFAVIDTVNGLVTFSVVYAVVVHLAHDRPDRSFVVRKLLVSPPLWALVAGLVVALADIPVHEVTTATFELIARAVGAMIMIALGVLFEPRFTAPRLLTGAILLRFGLGAAIGLGFVAVSGLSGLDAQIVLFAALAPVGVNTITFAQLENLDTGFAASLVSTSLVVGFLLSPFTVSILT